MTAPIDKILPHLTRVKPTAPGKWIACCPAHEDRSPSLAVRELDDGRLLLHCFGGCRVEEVVGAIGLGIEDLFPPRDAPGAAPIKRRQLISATQALKLLDDEATLIAVAAGNIGIGIALTDDDIDRVMQAAGRIAYLKAEVMS